MKFKLNIDTKELLSKPAFFDGQLRKRLCSAKSIRDVTPEQLIECIRRGRSFTPAVMTGTTGDTWQSQQIICADIDNDTGDKDADGNKIMLADPLTPERAIKAMEDYGIDPYFMYYSFSNSDSWPKFRIVLVLDEPITDPKAASDLTARFTGIFNEAEPNCADTKIDDNARIFYGSRPDSVFYIGGWTTSTDSLRALPIQEDAERDQAEPRSPERVSNWTQEAQEDLHRSYSELQAQFEYDKEHFDLAEYVRITTNSRPVKRGRAQFFNPCPICGHNDDFQVTGSIYHCHSASGGTGGSIIDYLMNRDGLDIGAACDKFKYEIMG